jgi:hypothetical protein
MIKDTPGPLAVGCGPSDGAFKPNCSFQRCKRKLQLLEVIMGVQVVIVIEELKTE